MAGGIWGGAAKRARALLDSELAQESVAEKVQMHLTRGEMQSLVAHDKAVRRALSREMSRPAGGRAAQGADPLARVSRRVTAANPLLEDD